jgi:hypothetical protein
MRDVSRATALLIAVLLLLRDDVIAAGADAMRTATIFTALLVLLGMTLWRDGFVTASGVALGAHYAGALVFGKVEIDLAAPFVAGLIVVYLELLDLAASLPRDRRVDRPFAMARLRHAGVVLGIAVAGGVAAFGVAAVPWPSSQLLRAVGVAGATVAVAVPLGLARVRR